MDVWWQRFTHLFLFCLALCSSGFFSEKLSLNDASFVLPYRMPEPNLPAPFIQALSMGHWPVIVDGLWIRFLVDPSMDKVEGDHRTAVFYDLLSASEMDSAFFDLHYFGGNLLSVLRGDHDGARILLERARLFQNTDRHLRGADFIKNFWPAPYSISLTLGYLYLFEFADFSKAEKIFQEASLYPRAPEYLSYLAARLRDPIKTVELGIRTTHELLRRKLSETAKNKVFERLLRLEVTKFILLINQDWKVYSKKHSNPRLSEFLSEKRANSTDPWGGKLFLNEKNQIETYSSRIKLDGL